MTTAVATTPVATRSVAASSSTALSSTDPYISETYHRPSGCTALDRLGNPLTGQRPSRRPATRTSQCAESNMLGTQASPQSGTELLPGDLPPATTARRSTATTASPRRTSTSMRRSTDGQLRHRPGGRTLVDDSGRASPLPQYAPLDGYGRSTRGTAYSYPEQPLTPNDYIVSVDIPNDKYGKPTCTR